MGIVVDNYPDSWLSNTTMDPTTPPTQVANADGRLACLDNTCRGLTNASCCLSSNGDINTAKSSLTRVQPFIGLYDPFWGKLATVSFSTVVCSGRYFVACLAQVCAFRDIEPLHVCACRLRVGRASTGTMQRVQHFSVCYPRPHHLHPLHPNQLQLRLGNLHSDAMNLCSCALVQ